MKLIFRLAEKSDLEKILEIIEDAKNEMARENRDQWNTEYPDRSLIEEDLNLKHGYVLSGNEIVSYASIFFNHDDEYQNLKTGKWLTLDGEYMSMHRLAVKEEYKGKGIASLVFANEIELGRKMGLKSFRGDTREDNKKMLHLFDKFGFEKTGTLEYPNGTYITFEKLL